MKSRHGFTLIELLIVVAIIAILAAIAVPNFLEAQVRSKVSRVKADLRTLATAIEAYNVDYNHPAPEARGAPPNTGVLAPRVISGFTSTGILGVRISTPVAYITNGDLKDPFFQNEGPSASSAPDVQIYTYKVYDYEWKTKADSLGIGNNEGANLNGFEFKKHYGQWRLFSAGPDRIWSNKFNPGDFGGTSPVGIPYDTTNGTVSIGSVIRSQSEPDQRTWKVY